MATLLHGRAAICVLSELEGLFAPIHFGHAHVALVTTLTASSQMRNVPRP